MTWHSLILAGTGHHTGARAEFLQLFEEGFRHASTSENPGQPPSGRRLGPPLGHPAPGLEAVDWPIQPPFRWQGQLVPIEADKRKLGYLTRGGVRLWQD